MGSVLQGVTVALGEQRWLDPVADRVQQLVAGLYEAGGGVGRTLKNAMHGLWLGHPLHPALTDVPVGAWTAAAVLDTLEAAGDNDLAPGADAAVTIGLVASVGAALTGITDWSATDGPARRQGLVHGWLNTAALLLYLASLLQRRNGRRPEGRALAFAGYAIAAASAYIGGHLVSNEQIGVDHAANRAVPEEYTSVIEESELPENVPHRVEVEGTPVVLVRRSSRVYALAETCAHLGGPLSEGTLDGESIICPWHGSRFALEDGSVENGPSAFSQPCFDARVREGMVEVRGRQNSP